LNFIDSELSAHIVNFNLIVEAKRSRDADLNIRVNLNTKNNCESIDEKIITWLFIEF